MSRVGFVGTGHIAAPMARFLRRKGHDIVVSRRSEATSAALQAEFPEIEVMDNQGVVDSTDIVFLCLRPHVWVEVISGLRFRADQQIVSVMAGASLSEIASACAPASRISVTIPLGFLEQGGCPLPACPSDETLAPLFNPENPVLEVPEESALNAHFAICAMVPGLLDLMHKSAGWLGAQTGNMDSAEFYTKNLMGGFLAAVPDATAGQLAIERDALATKGTLSLQMVEALRQGGADTILEDALTAIGKRLEGNS